MWHNSIILGSYLAAIVLDASSDAVRDNGNKTLGHILEALSVATFLSMPFTFNADVSQLAWYIVPYALLRISLFDVIYNKLRKVKTKVEDEEGKEVEVEKRLPICYHGTTSVWDSVLGRFKVPCGAELFGRFIALVGGVAMILQMIK